MGWLRRGKVLEEAIAQMELRPPVMELKFTVDGTDLVRMTTQDLYNALKYVSDSPEVGRSEWWELIGLGCDGVYIGDTHIELSIRKVEE